jgi:pimeloyl-ACP methyl ester carboxylesterase
MDLDSAVRNRLHVYLPPVADAVAYVGLKLWAPLFLPQPIREYSPMRHLAAIPASCTVVFLSGSADDRALPAECGQMCERIHSHARIVRFEGAGHATLCRRDAAKYLNILRSAADSIQH